MSPTCPQLLPITPCQRVKYVLLAVAVVFILLFAISNEENELKHELDSNIFIHPLQQQEETQQHDVDVLDEDMTVATHNEQPQQTSLPPILLPLVTSSPYHLRTKTKSPTQRPSRRPVTPPPPPPKTYAKSYTPYIPSRGKRVRDYPHRDFSIPAIRTSTFNNSLPSCISYNLTAFPMWQNCDRPCTLSEMQQMAKFNIVYPHKTSFGQDTGKFVDDVLRVAWGPNPPRVDLYVRTGCRGTDELHILLQSVAIFWPRFLGEVIIVLDVGDEPYLPYMIPLDHLTHSYNIIYEHCPCMEGRFFNQYSYLNLDRHTDASYVVTVDSDCVFHTPVTPDLLFNNKAQLKMVVSALYQSHLGWNEWQRAITHVDNRKIGHAMVTQPVSVSTASLKPFFDWVKKQNNGTCYERLLPNLVGIQPIWFCWMCQLNVFLAVEDPRGIKYGVDIHNIDVRRDPYLRYLIHYPYEDIVMVNRTKRKLARQEQFPLVINEGLCKWFGAEIFPQSCAMEMETTLGAGLMKAKEFLYLEYLQRTYAQWSMNLRLPEAEVRKAMNDALVRLKEAAMLVLDTSSR